MTALYTLGALGIFLVSLFILSTIAKEHNRRYHQHKELLITWEPFAISLVAVLTYLSIIISI